MWFFSSPSPSCGFPSQRMLASGIIPFCLVLLFCGGCTSFTEYVQNGFKVGPNYKKPPAPVAESWIDSTDSRVSQKSEDLASWWKVFNDPVLDDLICRSYQQNISLREAGFRVLQARAEWAIAVGEIFPQTQTATGSYSRQARSLQNLVGVAISGPGVGLSPSVARFFNQLNFGFNLAWEVDFWGRFRRAVEAGRDNLDASVEDYDAVLTTLLGDVATYYVNIRAVQQAIYLTRENVKLQRETLKIAEAKFQAGRTTELDVAQARSTLAQTEASISQLKIQLRQANNRLCVLLGIPPQELQERLGPGPIPRVPLEVAVGIPADLLRRRPEVRRAERLAAAASARIGIAESDFYPHILINGTLNWQSQSLERLFTPTSYAGSIGPSFTWNILNYGRLLNNVRLEKARFEETIATYQRTVLTAAEETENGLVSFLESQERVKRLTESVQESQKAVKIAILQFEQGKVDFNRVAVLQQDLVQQQDLLAQAQGAVALGLIQVYRALGGGWQIRINGCTVAGEGMVPNLPQAAGNHLSTGESREGRLVEPELILRTSQAQLGLPEVPPTPGE